MTVMVDENNDDDSGGGGSKHYHSLCPRGPHLPENTPLYMIIRAPVDSFSESDRWSVFLDRW